MMKNAIFFLLVFTLLFAKPPLENINSTEDFAKLGRSLFTVTAQFLLGLAFLIVAYFIYMRKIQGLKKAEELWMFAALALLMIGLLMVMEAVLYATNHFIF